MIFLIGQFVGTVVGLFLIWLSDKIRCAERGCWKLHHGRNHGFCETHKIKF